VVADVWIGEGEEGPADQPLGVPSHGANLDGFWICFGRIRAGTLDDPGERRAFRGGELRQGSICLVRGEDPPRLVEDIFTMGWPHRVLFEPVADHDRGFLGGFVSLLLERPLVFGRAGLLFGLDPAQRYPGAVPP
jgi:hypothetical protein